MNNSGGHSTFVSLYDKSGNSLGCGGLLSGCSGGTETLRDPNGNTIVENLNTGIVTDSLGLTAVSWPAGGGSTIASWTDVNGGTPSLSYSNTGTAGMKTNFGCTSPSINDFTSGSSGTAVTSTVTLADNRTATLTFEPTPSNTGFITGRPYVLTLPEGGTVTFTYGGGHNGIDCTYQTAPVLTRTLGNGDVTTYTLTHPRIGTTSNYQALNVLIDPGGNETDYTFTGFSSTGVNYSDNQLLAQVQRYQGNGGTKTLLSTDYYCYNPSPSCPALASIATTPVAVGPITEVVVYHLPVGITTPSAVDTQLDSNGNVTYQSFTDFNGAGVLATTSVTYGTCSASAARQARRSSRSGTTFLTIPAR